MTGPSEPTVRAVFTAATAPGAAAPFDTLHLKVHHPARFDGSDHERLTGEVAVDLSRGRLPIVVLLPGINVGPASYGWLAAALAATGCAVVTFSWVAEVMPGQRGLTCGLDLDAVRPDTYGRRPSATAIAPVLDALTGLDAAGPLAGCLDLDRLAVGGHSAGATVAYENATTDFFPSLRAVFGYGGHTLASTLLGWDADTLLPLPGDVPVLLTGGTRDGVIGASTDRYGRDGHDRDPVVRTFEDATAPDRDAYLAIVTGANHFAVGDPSDPTVARGFLDLAPVGDPRRHRQVLVELVTAFLARHLVADGRSSAATDATLDAALDAALASGDLELARRRQPR